MRVDEILKKLDPAIAITLKFVLAGIVWILFSDSLLNYISPQSSLFSISHIQVLKGIFFIGVTGAFIFIIAHDYSQTIKTLQDELQVFFKASPAPMVMVNAGSFRISDVNESAVRLFGFSPKEFFTMRLQEMIFPEDEEKFQSVLLFIKTGFDSLGTWKFRKNDNTFLYATISASPLKNKTVFLISFADITAQIHIEKELNNTTKDLQQHIAKRTDQLERINEELAYRASQTEHVNAELILVNERLLTIHKKVVSDVQSLKASSAQIEKIFLELKAVAWSFDLTGNKENYLTQSAEDFFETPLANINKAWFWLDFIHPDDLAIKESHQRMVMETGESCCLCRIISAKGTVRNLFIHVRVVRDQNENSFLVGSARDITGFPAIDVHPYLKFKMA